jgi:non-ribosomal peptide synthetase component F
LRLVKGGAPLDLSSPAERVAFMLQDAGASVLVTEDRFLEELSAAAGAVKIVCLDTDQAKIAEQSAAAPASGVAPENLAYVIYTSGSSGAPKGTLLTHANVTRLLAATDDVFHFDERDVWTLFHSYAFDFSLGTVWSLAFRWARSPSFGQPFSAEFYQLLRREREALNQTPPRSGSCCWLMSSKEQREQLALRLVIFGGEALG